VHIGEEYRVFALPNEPFLAAEQEKNQDAMEKTEGKWIYLSSWLLVFWKSS